MTSAEIESFQRQNNVLVLPIANNNGPRLTSDPTIPDGREVIKVRNLFIIFGLGGACGMTRNLSIPLISPNKFMWFMCDFEMANSVLIRNCIT